MASPAVAGAQNPQAFLEVFKHALGRDLTLLVGHSWGGAVIGPMFYEKLTVAAWKTKPSWAFISAKDRMLPPAMEESAAKKMDALTTTLPTCHMVILEEPAKVAAVIDEAAKKAVTESYGRPRFES
jgi:pimeloyl-ACP methyl ester carboxylesterase